MRKRFLALAMAGTMLVGGTLTAYAQDISVTGDTATGSSPTTFEVTAEMLGGDLVVTVPDTLTLEYDSENSQFSKTSQVNAKGNINPSKKLEVSVPTDITYLHADDGSVDAEGTLSFGATDGDNQKSTWLASDLQGGGSAGVDKDLTSTVPLSEVEYIGTYEATVTFDIELVDVN